MNAALFFYRTTEEKQLDAKTLQAIVPTLSMSRAHELAPGLNAALLEAECDTEKRAAVFVAQTAEESASYRASEEYASGSEYNGRSDLGNTHPGDGERFKGRSFIQVTGRNNYGRVSLWLFHKGIVPSRTYFLDHPEQLANDEYVWDGPVWYWHGDHNHGYSSINAGADAGNFIACTEMVNGGTNGLETREYYYHRALAQGKSILPTKPEANFVNTLTLLRAIILGGKYATPKLKKKYPSLVHEGGLAGKLTRINGTLDRHKAEMAKMQAEIDALKANSGKSAPNPPISGKN